MPLIMVALCFAANARVVTFAQAVGPPNAATTGSLTGTIVDAAHHRLAGVEVSTVGQKSRSVVTDDKGSFSIDDLPQGVYTVNFTKPGFTPVDQSVVVVAGTTTNASLTMASASLSSIQSIGRVSAASSSGVGFNTSTASVAHLTGESMIDQGQLNVNRVLNQIPGLTIGLDSGNSIYASGQNGASPLAAGIPTLRGSLPYETESLIDGHPINIGLSGTFNPAFINPYMLQDVQVVKGPGAGGTNINYAIGGTVNFRTLEPTLQPAQSFDLGTDQFGGQNANIRATGTALGGKLGYAFDYATQGTQGPDRGLVPLNPLLYTFGGGLVNGVPLCANPAVIGQCSLGEVLPGAKHFIGNPTPLGAVNFTTPLIMTCCQQISLDSSGRNELGKLRYSFTPSTSLTVTYLGGQLRGAQSGAYDYTLGNYFFEPPASYAGSVPAYTELPEDNQDRGELYENVNLFSAEARTSVGPFTLNARYYGASDDDAYGVRGQPNQVFTGPLYGCVPLGNATTPTCFNGQVGTVTALDALFSLFEKDRLSGYTLAASVPLARNTLSVSYDSSHDQSVASELNESPTPIVILPNGSSQTFRTIAFQGQFALSTMLNANLGDYATMYTDHFSQDLGLTFAQSTHTYNAPRLAFTYRPGATTSIRAATGFSVAPPYLSLLTNTALQRSGLPPQFTQTANSGDIAPETAFGWDVGADQRFGHDFSLSGDIYQTLLHNEFLTTQFLSPTPITVGQFNPYGVDPGTYPIYITKTQNLGHAEYAGIELAIARTPAVGVGFKLQGALQRAYPYDLPAGFYNTASGPNTANLAVLPNVNFQTSGTDYNGISQSRVPYSQGYAEVNFRTRGGAYFLAGVTYYGPNNAYNEPAFGVVTASYRQPLGKRISLLLSVYNLTNAYSSFTPNDYTGVGTPLVNGMLGSTYGNQIGPSTASLSLHIGL